VSFDNTLYSVDGHWHGTPNAVVLNDSELGIASTLTATGKNDTWGDKLTVKNYEVRRPWVPFADVDIPKNPALEGKTLRVRVTMPVTYPVSDGKTFRDESKTLTKEVSIQVATASGTRGYWTAWGLAIGVGSFSNVVGGMALCLLGLTLRSRGQPTETQPIEKNAQRSTVPPRRAERSAAPQCSEPAALPGAIAKSLTKPPRSFGSLETAAVPRSGPLAYFHAKLYSPWKGAGTVYRVYVTDQDFLFVDLGVGTITPEDHAQQTPAMMGGGLIPALIGQAIGQALAAVARQRLERLKKSLAAADEDVLREYVDGDEDSFILPVAEVQGARLNPKTFWGALMCRNLVAFLELNRRHTGVMTLALLDPTEMVTIMGEMKRVFGEIECNLSWRAF
jgi:hypothetical protein